MHTCQSRCAILWRTADECGSVSAHSIWSSLNTVRRLVPEAGDHARMNVGDLHAGGRVVDPLTRQVLQPTLDLELDLHLECEERDPH